MKKLYYDQGPLVMNCGAAGEFRRGVPKDVEDELAAILLRKGRHKEFVDPASAEANSSLKSVRTRAVKEKEE